LTIRLRQGSIDDAAPAPKRQTDAPIDQIVDAIQAAALGESVISPRIAARSCNGCASIQAAVRAVRGGLV